MDADLVIVALFVVFGMPVWALGVTAVSVPVVKLISSTFDSATQNKITEQLAEPAKV